MKKNTINLSMQLCKLFAAVFVVFIHFGFPGRLGMIIDCIARFAVPIFFAISGYFSYKIDNDKIKKRIIYMLKLNIFAITFYLLINIFEQNFIFHNNIFDYLHSVFNLTSIAKWIIINYEPISGHLWYLASMLFIYIGFYIYTRFFDQKSIDYKPLYIISVFLLCIHILLGSYVPASGIEMSYIVYRNALFWGFPMFGIGLFVNQYYKRLIKKFNLSSFKLILMIIVGFILSLIEYIGIGKTEMPLGMIVTVIGLLLLAIKHPNSNLIKNQFILSIIKTVPLIVYIVHLSVNWILLKILPVQIYSNGYLYPFIVLGVSIVVGFLYALVEFIVKKNISKK